MSRSIKKAVFPVAGLGTRFLPATKANPKEMLPIVDKPLIQYAVEEAVAAGVTELIFITGRNKRSIEDHFDKAYELEIELQKQNKLSMLEGIRSVLPVGVACIYIRQAEPLGLGHAAVLLADDLINGAGDGCLSQMVDLYSRYNCGVLAVETVPREDTGKYGIVVSQPIEPRVSKLHSIIEKPKPEVAPSTLAVVGRYILPPEIMELLAETGSGTGGEIQLTDGIAKLLERKTVLSLEFEGKRYDCGSKLGYLEAMVEYALRHHELREDFERYLHSFTAHTSLTQRSAG